jgi:hypothetical protein
MKCKRCKRNIPNKELITENGCVWCDIKYYTTRKKDDTSKSNT